jgi:sugar lactone lactonase YvrE/enterochelin esterase-like enzyme
MPRLLLASLALFLLTTTIRADDHPKGEVTKYTFDKSKIFPGTTRDYWVYVPKQYDGKTPACVYINQDGIQYKAPEVFDELIDKKEIPILIGIFVQPGVVKPPSDKALPRFNRSYEYDGLGDAYARFLLEELLPEVEKKTTKDGRAIHLSKKGNDRCIAGASSGAICAFTAAWERPDDFRRVFSAIGTYVGLRGGNVYPTLIRKYEPKPLRVFLQDGKNDLNIYGGDWWMANQEMERALTFAGYEVNHVWGEGGHSGEHATKIFPDAMRWLWKDWPAPIKVGKGSQQLQEILVPGEGWRLVGEGYKSTYAPAVNAKGEVFFNDSIDFFKNKTFKIGLDGKVSLAAAERERIADQAFGPDGRLYGVTKGKKLMAYDANGKATVIADEIGGRYYHIVVRHDGGIYVTSYGFEVWYITPKGEKKLVDARPMEASGVALSPDQSLLYVADHASHWVYSYQVQPNGSLTNAQKYFHLHTQDNSIFRGSDGLRVDREGRLWAVTDMGIQVCDQAGRVNCIIPSPNDLIEGIAFGGADFDILYAICGDKVYKRKVKVKGANAFEAPIKPKPPQL